MLLLYFYMYIFAGALTGIIMTLLVYSVRKYCYLGFSLFCVIIWPLIVGKYFVYFVRYLLRKIYRRINYYGIARNEGSNNPKFGDEGDQNSKIY